MNWKLGIGSLVFLCFFQHSQGQSLEWAHQIVTGIVSAAEDIGVDGDGNVYIVGSYSNQTDFDPGPGTAYLTGNQAYFAKYDSAGNFLWVYGIPNTRFIGIKVDPAGYLFLYGRFTDTLDFDFGPGTYILSPQSNNHEAMVLKYDLSANIIWGKSMGAATGLGSQYDEVFDLEFDSQGNVWFCGTFKGTGDFDPGPGVFTLSSAGDLILNGFVEKLDPQGNFLWGGALVSQEIVRCNGLEIDANDKVYVYGSFYSLLDCDPDAIAVQNLNAQNSQAAYLIKLGAAGNLIWGKQFSESTTFNWVPEELVLTKSGDGLIMLGRLSNGSVDVDPGPGTFLLSGTNTLTDPAWVRWDTSGNFVYGKHLPKPSAQNFGTCMSRDINGDIYIFGSFQDSTDFDPGPGLAYGVGSPNHLTGFIAKYDAMGNYLSHATFGNNNSTIGNVWIWGAKLDNDFHIYLTGDFQGTNDFDPGAGTTQFIAGDDDIYFLKLGQAGLVGQPSPTTLLGVSAYPNPATEILIIDSPEAGIAVLFDTQGAEVLRQRISAGRSNIILDGIPGGIYLLSVDLGPFQVSQRIVVAP